MNNLVKFVLGCILYFFWPTITVGQSLSSSSESFKIFLLSGRYDKDTQTSLKKNILLSQYKYLAEYMIDPKGEGKFRNSLIISKVSELFPDPSATGYLSLNIESKIYKDLKKYPKHSKEFKNAVMEFTRIINVIKKTRPNVKVGVYGLPFKFYYPSQRQYNANNKLDVLLEQVDYISPSLYFDYPDMQRGASANRSFLKSNLDYVLSTGIRLNKPVVPFVWHMIHPSNKKFGGDLIDRDELHNHLNFIRNYTVSGRKVAGLLWWEPSYGSFSTYIKTSNSRKRVKASKIPEQSSVIKYYLEGL